MSTAVLNILPEPIHEATYWYNQIYAGIKSRALYRRHEPIFITEKDLSADLTEDPIIVIGATPAWLEHITRELRVLGLRGLLVSSGEPPRGYESSCILLNHRDATQQIVAYLSALGRSRLALVGFNPHSLNDKEKLIGMRDTMKAMNLPFTDESIFPLRTDIQQALDAFCDQCERFDSVICVNDVIGVALLNDPALREKRAIPKDLYIASFGNTILARLATLSLTSVTLNYRDVGLTTVDAAITLRKHPQIYAQHTYVRSMLIIGESTENQPLQRMVPAVGVTPPTAKRVGFYKDELTCRFLHIEELLVNLDSLDARILSRLLLSEPKMKIIDELYIAESTYKYHLRRILNAYGADIGSLLNDLRCLINPQRLEEYGLRQIDG